MGFWSTVGSAISSGISACCSAISSAVSAIGGALASAVGAMAPAIATIMTKLPAALNSIVTIAEALMTVLDIMKPDEKAEELGDKAIQAGYAGKKPENYDNYAEYLDDIRNFELDPQQTESIPKAAKLAAGLAVTGKVMEEKFNLADGDAVDIIKLICIAPDHFTSTRLEYMVRTGSDFASVIDYFNGKLSPGSADNVEKKMLEVETSLNAQTDSKAFYQEIDAIKEKEKE